MTLRYHHGFLRLRFAPLRMTRWSVPANPAATEHNVTVVNDCSLSGRYGSLRIVQSHMCAIVFQWRNCRKRSGMIVSNFHGAVNASLEARVRC